MAIAMLMFAERRWLRPGSAGAVAGAAGAYELGGLGKLLLETSQCGTVGGWPGTLSAEQIVGALFCCNFIGVATARSLHFQFLVWYFHTLPLLLWMTRLPLVAKLAVFYTIEICWNPWSGESSSVASSALLTAAHAVLLVALWVGPAPAAVSGKKAE